MPGGINGEVYEGEINYYQVKTERKIKVQIDRRRNQFIDRI